MKKVTDRSLSMVRYGTKPRSGWAIRNPGAPKRKQNFGCFVAAPLNCIHSLHRDP